MTDATRLGLRKMASDRSDTVGHTLHRSRMPLRTWLTGPLIVAVLLAGATAASACPMPPPDTPTIRQMIVRGSTEVESRPLLLLGRVRATRDIRGGPKGYAIARFRVVEDAIGRVPNVVRVRFYVPKPKDEDTSSVSPYRILERGDRWALVSRRRASGIVEFALTCSESRPFVETRFRNLVHLARHGRGRAPQRPQTPAALPTRDGTAPMGRRERDAFRASSSIGSRAI